MATDAFAVCSVRSVNCFSRVTIWSAVRRVFSCYYCCLWFVATHLRFIPFNYASSGIAVNGNNSSFSSNCGSGGVGSGVGGINVMLSSLTLVAFVAFRIQNRKQKYKGYLGSVDSCIP